MLYDEKIGRQIADFLLEIKAVILRPEQPFKWTSGWNSPIYCDNRLILSSPEVRRFVISNWAAAIKELFPQAEALAGVATAGIAHAALIAAELDLPMAYIRPKPKEHGTGKLIEGRLDQGQKVVVIEDLVSTGKSSAQAVEGVKNEGVEVLGLMSIFSYGFPDAIQLFKDANVDFYNLSQYDILIEQAIERGYVEKEKLPVLQQWRKDPANWKP